MAYVSLWFDCEDYITPLSDDAALWLAELCTDLGITATFKMVGEKVRVLQRRGRQDVLEAIGRHDVGYHTDNHSRHPTVAEYLEGLDWREGVVEFVRREGAGLNDLRQAFGKPVVCYGQPGGSWAPQAYGGLRQWDIPLYLDEGGNIGLDGAPFWYCGVLTAFGLRGNTCRLNHGDPEDLPRAKQRVADINERLNGQGGGLISIWYHPCEFATTRFWDGVNFARGEDRTPEEYVTPPLLDEADRRRRLGDLREWLTYIKSLPQAQFVGGWELVDLYPDEARGAALSLPQVKAVAAACAERADFVRVGDLVLSPAEALLVLLRAVPFIIGHDESGLPVRVEQVLGPAEPSPALAEPFTCRLRELAAAAYDAAEHAGATGVLPSAVTLAGRRVGPAPLLKAIGAALSNDERPDAIRIEPVELDTERHVADEDANLWGWVVFPEGFQAPRLQRLARLQAWTMKPAVLRA